MQFRSLHFTTTFLKWPPLRKGNNGRNISAVNVVCVPITSCQRHHPKRLAMYTIDELDSTLDYYILMITNESLN